MDCIRCSICLEFVSESIQALVKHICRILLRQNIQEFFVESIEEYASHALWEAYSSSAIEE